MEEVDMIDMMTDENCRAELRVAVATTIKDRKRIAQLEADKKLLAVRAYTLGYRSGHHDTVEVQYVDVLSCDEDTYWAEDIAEWLAEQFTALEQQDKGEGDG